LELCVKCKNPTDDILIYKSNIYCGDCAKELIIEVHKVSEKQAECILERIVFGNGKDY
jgi:hypothetical protein